MTFKIENMGIDDLKPTILMVIAETIQGASYVLFELASNDGSDLRILVAYRFLFAAAFMVPVALFVERNKRPKLTWKVIWLSLLSALVGGSLLQNLFVLGAVLTSTTFTPATTNLVTAITFILAICFSEDFEDMSDKLVSKLNQSIRTLSHPISLEEIIRNWDASARVVFTEFAEGRVRKSLGSNLGTWERCVTT